MSSELHAARSSRLRRGRVAAAIATLVVGLWVSPFDTPYAAAPRFYPDDPLLVDNDRAFDASGAEAFDLGNISNFVENTFVSPGDRSSIRALNVNTLDEVPDSSWFTNRIGRRPLTIAEIVRGPDRVDRLPVAAWHIVAGKSTGFQPGFRAVDPANPSQVYQIEFDAATNEELATGAEIIGTAFYHALGYNVVDVYLTEIDAGTLSIADTATIRDRISGKRRQFVKADLDDVLRGAARVANGRYRVLASRFAEGRPMGQFRYYGTRPDDPNDVYAHEHRRELRANRVFCAWLNHDDSRANNTLDMLVGPEGQRSITHYMFDFGSILGSGTQFADHPRAGYEYFVDAKPSAWTLLSLGLYVRPWLRVPDPMAPRSVGRFQGQHFDPSQWKPEYPNTAFDNMRPDDAFWGARLVAAFSDAAIRAVVTKAAYTDPVATDYLTQALIDRRDAIARRWLNAVNPVVDVVLSADGTLTFRNAAVDARAASPAASYRLAWSRFDNATDTHQATGPEQTVSDSRAAAPAEVLTGEFAAVTIRGQHAEHPRWADPLRVYFRRDGRGWKTVGLERP